MGMYAVETADSDELGALRGAARSGRAAAMSRRVQLSQGQQALHGGTAPPAVENANVPVNGAATPSAPNGQGAPDGTQGASGGTAVSTDGVGIADLGRALSKQRRRQLSQGKQALNGGGALRAAENLDVNGAGAPPVAPNGQGASNGAQGASGGTARATDGVGIADLGRALSKQRRRQLSQGKQALNGDGAPNGQSAPNGAQGASGGTARATDGVGIADLGRALSKQRRRQLSQGKQALNGDGAPPAAKNLDVNGAGAPPAAPDGQGAANGTLRASGETAVSTDGVGIADLGRALSKQRRRQLSQGKQALNGAGATPAAKNLHVDGADSGRDQARARSAEASRLAGAGVSGTRREGRVTYPPKVIVSPTQRGQKVTGLRIGPGLRVTGDEPGAALPVSGTQYVAADGSATAPGVGPKVGLVRTPQGLVVSGTTVRGSVPITGDEPGEHLRITGEADQKFDDDLTPRSDGSYRAAQFPRNADPHGATAVGTSLGLQTQTAVSGDGPWLPLETTVYGLAVTGTAVGRSGRVTGNEAGACRPITGDQYQDLPSYSSECAGLGGGTAPAAHLNRPRFDPVTGGKVTVAQTWGGQRVTGPSVEYRSNVTGDEPGSCLPVTGSPYQGPSTSLGWCESDEGDSAAQRLESRPEGVAVTGDMPMPSKAVTGTERGQRNSITGTSYYRDMRPAEPAADDWTGARGFPVALARRLACVESDGAGTRDADAAAPPASNVPGRITGAFDISADKVTGNNEFLFRPRPTREGKQASVSGEGRIEGRTITGSAAAWTADDRVTGTDSYIAAGRNPSEGGGRPSGWAGTIRFGLLATPGGPPRENVTGRSGWNPTAARVTLSGGARG